MKGLEGDYNSKASCEDYIPDRAWLEQTGNWAGTPSYVPCVKCRVVKLAHK